MQISFPKGLYDISERLRNLRALKSAFISMGGKIYYRNIEEGRNFFSCVYAVGGAFQDNIHQHEVRPDLHCFFYGIISRVGCVCDHISRTLKSVPNIEDYYLFILYNEYLLVCHEYVLPDI